MYVIKWYCAAGTTEYRKAQRSFDTPSPVVGAAAGHVAPRNTHHGGGVLGIARSGGADLPFPEFRDKFGI